MQFQNAIITEQGVRILQSGIANNPVVFTRFLFTGSPTPLTAQTVNLPEPTWGNGHVTNYAAGQNGFVLYMMATNDTDYGYAYGFGVYGYLQNEGIENEKLLIVANYAGNVTYVSEASGSYTRFHLAITVSLSMSNSVLAIAPRYDDLVSNTAFQDLLERTVTTHSAADPQVGDPQIVRGQKHFYDTTYFGGNSNAPFIEMAVDRENGSMYLNAEHESQQIRIQMKPKDYGDDSNNNVYVNTNISPSGDGLVSLGVNEHRWFEINTYSLWASDNVGVSNRYGRTSIGSEGIEFLNANDDSIGTIGIQNDTKFYIDGNGSPVHITSLTVDSGMSVVGSTELQGTTYVRSLLWANDNIRCDGSITISSVTLTGGGNVLSVNKSTTISGNVTCAQLFMTSNVMGINGAGGEPYYIGVNNGVLQIGMNNSGTNISGGALQVSSLNVDSFSKLKMSEGLTLGYENYPTIGQVTSTTANIALGAIMFALVRSDTTIYAGQEMPDGTVIQFMDFALANNGDVSASMNAFYITVSQQSHRYAPLSPVTYWDNDVHKYQNLTLVMRIK